MSRFFLTYVFLMLLSSLSLSPDACGGEIQDTRYQIQIDIRNAYVSGICIMHSDGRYVTASIVNEFGVSALSYRYDVRKRKVRILDIIRQMDRIPVRRVLKSDLKIIMEDLCGTDFHIQDKYEYKNSRHDISYSLKPICHEIER